MIPFLLEEEEFYLRDRAYHRMVARRYPRLKEICDKNADLDMYIVLSTKNQIEEERNGLR